MPELPQPGWRTNSQGFSESAKQILRARVKEAKEVRRPITLKVLEAIALTAALERKLCTDLAPPSSQHLCPLPKPLGSVSPCGPWAVPLPPPTPSVAITYRSQNDLLGKVHHKPERREQCPGASSSGKCRQSVIPLHVLIPSLDSSLRISCFQPEKKKNPFALAPALISAA